MQKRPDSRTQNRLIRLAASATVLSAMLAAASAAPAQAQAGPPETGVWYDDTGKGAVEVKQCGAKLCGYIVWLAEPIGTDGGPRIDRNNPDESKRTRPICGLQILGSLAKMEDGSWDSGWVYDPKVGKTYDAAIALSGPDSLTLTGYRAVKLLGKSFLWKRAPADLQKCIDTQSGGTGGEALPWAKKASAP